MTIFLVSIPLHCHNLSLLLLSLVPCNSITDIIRSINKVLICLDYSQHSHAAIHTDVSRTHIGGNIPVQILESGKTKP